MFLSSNWCFKWVSIVRPLKVLRVLCVCVGLWEKYWEDKWERRFWVCPLEASYPEANEWVPGAVWEDFIVDALCGCVYVCKREVVWVSHACTHLWLWSANLWIVSLFTIPSSLLSLVQFTHTLIIMRVWRSKKDRNWQKSQTVLLLSFYSAF